MTSIRKAAREKLNVLLGVAGFQLLRPGEKDHVRPFIPWKRTLEAARKAGLSVGDYIDLTYQVPGATRATIDQLSGIGVFRNKIDRVGEVGPGSGRYLDLIQRLCAPRSYEIYETDKEWSGWLTQTYHVTAHEADGTSLSATATGSLGLVHAHKVFAYLPFIVTCQYFGEMIRVTRPGGHIVFDFFSESCMSDATIQQWIEGRMYSRCVIPREFVIGFFARRHCSLRSSFLATAQPGLSEYLVLVKDEVPDEDAPSLGSA
jgi:hypothetical protein